ncbi:MAG: DEAD/DEAH box helicase family protein [Deltaproteobacteria bacterium]
MTSGHSAVGGAAARLTLRFHAGTLELHGLPPGATSPLPERCLLDPRTSTFRAPASDYADLLRALRDQKLELVDEARAYTELANGPLVHREPRPYQSEAIAAWKKARGAGVVVLPTGAGKTHVAVMAIDDKRRSTLVVAPTLDLVRQWHDLLGATFGMTVGLVGGGEHDVRPITVTTYDSAYLHLEHLGNRFGLVVFDECHHLPSATYALAARHAIAPFRLGLTATPERMDGRESLLDALVGPTVYRRDIVELAGDYLAEYETVRVSVSLSESERQEYEAERSVYRSFLSRNAIRMSDPKGWSQFIMLSARSADGRRAMAAYRRQRELAFSAPAKLDYVERLLWEHRHDRALLFTQDNATCYALSRRFLIPAITHQTKVKERGAILRGLAEGTYGAVVTSKVLNEGVDVPDANVAIVVSGSGSVREHVQRLGRILRKRDGKFALLYEIVTAETAEAYTSERRRDHAAYR